MKTLTQVRVNEMDCDAVIVYWMKEKRDPEGNIIWSDEKSHTSRTVGHPEMVNIYAPVNNSLELISISANSIKKLFEEFKKIETIEGEDFFD